MDISIVRNEIEKNDIAILGQMDAMNYLRKKIVIEIKPFVKAELKRLIEKEVSRNSEHTISLSKNVLGEMKKKFFKIIESSEDKIDDIFSKDELWLHIGYKVVSQGNMDQVLDDKTKAEENITNAIRLALGQAGQLLIDYGYEKVETKTGQHADYVLNDYILYNNKRIEYRSEMILPKTLVELLKDYCQRIGELHGFLQKDLKLKKSLTQKKALDLWSEV